MSANSSAEDWSGVAYEKVRQFWEPTGHQMTELLSKRSRNHGRPRAQKGSLIVKSGAWLGRYYRYLKNGKTERSSFKIGAISEVSEAEARAILKSAIDRHIAKQPLLDRVGKNGLVAANSEHKSNLAGRRGAVAELLVCADLMAKDLEVFRAVDPQTSCDLIAIDRERRFLRVEVKAVSRAKDGSVPCDIRRNIGKFDLIAFVFPGGHIEYRNPEEIIHHLHPLGREGAPQLGSFGPPNLKNGQ